MPPFCDDGGVCGEHRAGSWRLSRQKATVSMSTAYVPSADDGWTASEKCDRNAYPLVLNGEALTGFHDRAWTRTERHLIMPGTPESQPVQGRRRVDGSSDNWR